MTTYVTLDVMNNKFPCEGPRVVTCPCDFSQASNFNVDLKSLVQQAKISEVQSLFIDNSDNNFPLTVVISVQNQRIVVPANAQAYLNVLCNLPQFNVSSQGSAAMVNIFAQNFPVTNCVWFGAGASSNVSVNNFPVIQSVSFASSVSNAFTPSFPGINLVTGAASANIAIAPAIGMNIRVFNAGAFPVSFRYGVGAQVAIAADLTLAPNQSILLNSNGANNLAAISPGGAGSINISIGYGGLSA